MPRAYFDHNATTPLASELLAAMPDVSARVWANPSSIHRDGQAARQLIEEARAKVARLLGCAPKEVAFTSGGTEAANLAILGAVRADARGHKHVVTTAVEHPAVLEACAQLETEGVAVTYVQPGANGSIDPDRVRRQIRQETVLVSVMHANNETGAVQPVAEIGRICRDAGVLFHSDGVQAAGKLDTNVVALSADLYSISGHKLNAPKGIGALYVRGGVELRSLLHGGKQERQRRPGTENLLGAWAMGFAADLPRPDLSGLRDRLEQGVLARVPDVTVNGAGVPRVPNTTNLCFDGIEGESLVIALDLKGFAVSTGSACSSGTIEPSHVLLAMGLPPERAKSSLRFSLGLGNTESQVDALIDAVAECAARLRKLSPTYTSAAH